MKTTYTETWTMSNEELQEAEVIIYIFDEDKYTEEITEEIRTSYYGVTAWDIIKGGEEAEEIEADNFVDEHHEYLVLHFNDGETATFRNSHVDMHIR